MRIIVDGNEKEVAAFVLAIQGQRPEFEENATCNLMLPTDSVSRLRANGYKAYHSSSKYSSSEKDESAPQSGQ